MLHLLRRELVPVREESPVVLQQQQAVLGKLCKGLCQRVFLKRQTKGRKKLGGNFHRYAHTIVAPPVERTEMLSCSYLGRRKQVPLPSPLERTQRVVHYPEVDLLRLDLFMVLSLVNMLLPKQQKNSLKTCAADLVEEGAPPQRRHLEVGQISLYHVLVEDGAGGLGQLAVPLPRPRLRRKKKKSSRNQIDISGFAASKLGTDDGRRRRRRKQTPQPVPGISVEKISFPECFPRQGSDRAAGKHNQDRCLQRTFFLEEEEEDGPSR